MRRVLALIAVVAAVIAAGVVVGRRLVRRGDVETAVVVPAADPVVEAPAESPPRSAIDSSEGVPEGTALVVRVVRADGTTAPGATLILSREPGGGPATLSKPTTLSKPAGEFGYALFSRDEIKALGARDDGAPVGRTRLLWIRAEYGGDVGIADRWVKEASVTERPDRPIDPDAVTALTVYLRDAAPVSGRVIDEDSAAVPSARCSLWWPREVVRTESTESQSQIRLLYETVTGADGSFAFPPVPAITGDATGSLFARAAGFAQVSGTSRVKGSGDTEIVIRMEHRLTIRGRCVDAAGRPVCNATIVTGMKRHATTDQDGRFALEQMLPADRRIGIESRDLAPVGVGVPGDGRKDVDLGEIVVPEGAKLRARIVDADDAPVSWSLVDIEADGGTSWSQVDRTDAAGRVERDHMPEGTVRLVVHHPRRCAGAIVAVAGVPTGTQDEVRVVLPRLPEFTLRFVDAAADRPAPRVETATITVWAVEDTSEKTHYDAFRYDVAGDRIVLMVPKPGAYRAQVEVPGFAPARVERFEVTADGRADVAVPLAEAR